MESSYIDTETTVLMQDTAYSANPHQAGVETVRLNSVALLDATKRYMKQPTFIIWE